MSLRVRNPRDFLAGVIFFFFGAVGILVGADYDVGTAGRMGPGYFPMVLSGGLLMFGLIIAGRGVATNGEPLDRASLRPLLAVLFSVALFGLTLERFGLLIAVPLVVLVMAFATPSRRWPEVALSAIAMSVFCILVFVVGLDQQLRIWAY